MADRFTIDASIVAKWFIEKGESDLQIARRLAHQAETAHSTFYAPDLLLIEIANTLHYKSEVSLSTTIQAIEYLSILPALHLIRLESNLIKQASELAAQTSLSLYDACYVAVAELTNTRLITADQKMLKSYRQALMLKKIRL